MVCDNIDKYIKNNKDKKDLVKEISKMSIKFNVSENYIIYKLFDNGIDDLRLNYESKQLDGIKYMLDNYHKYDDIETCIYDISDKFNIIKDVLYNHAISNNLFRRNTKDSARSLLMKYVYHNKIDVLKGKFSSKTLSIMFHLHETTVDRTMRYTIPVIYNIISNSTDMRTAREYINKNIDDMKDEMTVEYVSNQLCIAPGNISRIIANNKKKRNIRLKNNNNKKTIVDKPTKRDLLEQYLKDSNICIYDINTSMENEIANKLGMSWSYVHYILATLKSINKTNNIDKVKMKTSKKQLVSNYIMSNNLLYNLTDELKCDIAIKFDITKSYVQLISTQLKNKDKHTRRIYRNGTNN